MQKIKFITDTASDIPEKYVNQIDIDVLSFPITVDGIGYLEGIDFTPEEFITILNNSQETPTTAHVTMPTFLDIYERYYKEDYTHIIVVPINSKGSNTYNAAFMARDAFYEKKLHVRERMTITILDAQMYSMGYGYPLIQAGLMAKRGENAYHIITYLEDAYDKMEVLLSLTDLEHAKKSGRITAAAAFMGELLGLRPIMRLKNGEIKTITKVRGNAAIAPALVKEMGKYRNKDPKYEDYLMLEAGNRPLTQEVTKAVRKAFGKKFRGTYQLGSAIMINAGPTVTGVAYFGNGEKK